MYDQFDYFVDLQRESIYYLVFSSLDLQPIIIMPVYVFQTVGHFLYVKQNFADKLKIDKRSLKLLFWWQ